MGDMKTEQLQPGQGLAGLGEGGAVKDLGPGDVEQMFGPATTPLERLRMKGMVDESKTEMGGGGIRIRLGLDSTAGRISENI